MRAVRYSVLFSGSTGHHAIRLVAKFKKPFVARSKLRRSFLAIDVLAVVVGLNLTSGKDQESKN